MHTHFLIHVSKMSLFFFFATQIRKGSSKAVQIHLRNPLLNTEFFTPEFTARLICCIAVKFDLVCNMQFADAADIREKGGMQHKFYLSLAETNGDSPSVTKQTASLLFSLLTDTHVVS